MCTLISVVKCTEVKWLVSKKTIIFQGSRGGSNIFQGGGGPTFPGGSNCLFPIETHITCDFPGGGGSGPPVPPSGSALGAPFDTVTLQYSNYKHYKQNGKWCGFCQRTTDLDLHILQSR